MLLAFIGVKVFFTYRYVSGCTAGRPCGRARACASLAKARV